MRAVQVNLPGGVLPCAEGQTGHLSGDTNTALVQYADGVLVSLSLLAEQVALGDDAVVEVEHTSAAGTNTKLLLFLGNRETGGILLDNESSDTLIALAGVNVGEDEENASLHGVSNPHLGSIKLVSISSLLSLSLEREGIGARCGLGETEGADSASSQLGEPGTLGLDITVLHDRGVDQCIVNIDHHTDAGVDARQLLDRDDRGGEVHSRTAELLWHLNAHQALLEELLHDLRVHSLGFIHFPDLRADLLHCELRHGVGHQGFRLGQKGDRRRCQLGEIDLPPAGGS